MANFLLVVDANSERREDAALKAYGKVAFSRRLRADIALSPHFAITWAAAPSAPVSRAVSTGKNAADCVLFGDPHETDGKSVSVEALRHRSSLAWTQRNELNGFYAAVCLHPLHGFRVEADVLGVFPVYHWQSKDVVLVGTSPALFRCHPSFQSSMDLHGVAAVLLTSGIVGGRTLWQGVRRLPADHVLFGGSGMDSREVPPSSIPSQTAPTNLDETVAQAADHHVSFLKSALKSARSPGLQLSGGLDSRLLAGFTTALGYRSRCLTFGRSGDLDARCATQVAQELDLPQDLCDVVHADYARYADSSVEWEQLSGGLYALPMGWNIALTGPEVQIDRMVCGLTLDAVIGGPKKVATAAGGPSFESLRIGRLGFDRNQLESLVAVPELARACDDVREEVVQRYVASGESDGLREWKMNLEHRHRFAVGACAWRYALFAWPVMPALDRKLIQLAMRLPYSVVKDRQVQTRMLISRFPRLARLELDRNYLDTTPLIGARRSLVFDVRRRLVKLKRRGQAWLGRDPRFYVRTMEFNSPGWRVVRSMADEARSAAHVLFRPEELKRLLPESHVTVRKLADPIIHSTPLKNTVGLMLWLRQYA